VDIDNIVARDAGTDGLCGLDLKIEGDVIVGYKKRNHCSGKTSPETS
jgi:hypothetical protein